jgi:hypothetical protein
MTSKTLPLIGAGCGLVTFLALGLLPSMLYGGYAGLLLAGGVLGTPVQPTLLARAFIVALLRVVTSNAGCGEVRQ